MEAGNIEGQGQLCTSVPLRTQQTPGSGSSKCPSRSAL